MPVMKLPSKVLHFAFITVLSGTVLPHSGIAQDIVGLTLVPMNGKPSIGVILDNPTSASLWFEVHVNDPEPVRCGSGRNELVAGQRMMVLCPVALIAAKTDYPITAVIDGDKEATKHIATKTRKGRFSKRDVKWLNAQLGQQP
jgi:hypothetical protein